MHVIFLPSATATAITAAALAVRMVECFVTIVHLISVVTLFASLLSRLVAVSIYCALFCMLFEHCTTLCCPHISSRKGGEEGTFGWENVDRHRC